MAKNISVVEAIVEKSFRDGGVIHTFSVDNQDDGFAASFLDRRRETVVEDEVVEVFREALHHSGATRDPEDILRYLREHEHMSLSQIQEDPEVAWGVEQMHQEYLLHRLSAIHRLTMEIERGDYSLEQLESMDVERLVKGAINSGASPDDARLIIERGRLDQGLAHDAQEARVHEIQSDQDRLTGGHHPGNRDSELLNNREPHVPKSDRRPNNDQRWANNGPSLDVNGPGGVGAPTPFQENGHASPRKQTLKVSASAPVLLMTMGGGRLDKGDSLAQPDYGHPGGDEVFFEGGRLGVEVVKSLRQVETRLGIGEALARAKQTDVQSVSKAIRDRIQPEPLVATHEFTPPDAMNVFGVGGDGIGTSVRKIKRKVQEYMREGTDGPTIG